jgi:hypothetical protein
LVVVGSAGQVDRLRPDIERLKHLSGQVRVVRWALSEGHGIGEGSIIRNRGALGQALPFWQRGRRIIELYSKLIASHR